MRKRATMKPKTRMGRIGRNGEIKIPSDYLKTLGLSPGEEVELQLTCGQLLVEPVKEAVAYQKKPLKKPVEALAGSIPLNDVKLIDDIVESEDIYG